MNKSGNASCRQLFKDLDILPLQSQYIYTQYFYLLLKIKIYIYQTRKYTKLIQDKLLICMYLQQT